MPAPLASYPGTLSTSERKAEPVENLDQFRNVFLFKRFPLAQVKGPIDLMRLITQEIP
jgi:hypothetical protein